MPLTKLLLIGLSTVKYKIQYLIANILVGPTVVRSFNRGFLSTIRRYKIIRITLCTITHCKYSPRMISWYNVLHTSVSKITLYSWRLNLRTNQRRCNL